MQTRPTPSAAIPGLIHESTRSTISTNRDPETGLAERCLRNSRLLVHWVGGEGRLRFECSEIKLAGQRTERPARPARRML